MYTTIIHPLRKGLNLSVNEYCVLDSIRNLSNNTKYGGWCIKPKQSIADDLDLSLRTIQNIIKTLDLKGLLLRGELKNQLRTADEFNKFFNLDSVKLLGMEDFISVSPNLFKDAPTMQNLHRAENAQPLRKNCITTVQNLHNDRAESAHYTNSNTNSNTNIKTKQGEKKIIMPFTSESFYEKWILWKEFKKEQFNFTYKPIGEQSSLMELSKLSNLKEDVALKIIQQSINKGWRGLFTLDTNNNGTNKESAEQRSKRMYNERFGGTFGYR